MHWGFFPNGNLWPSSEPLSGTAGWQQVPGLVRKPPSGQDPSLGSQHCTLAVPSRLTLLQPSDSQRALTGSRANTLQWEPGAGMSPELLHLQRLKEDSLVPSALSTTLAATLTVNYKSLKYPFSFLDLETENMRKNQLKWMLEDKRKCPTSTDVSENSFPILFIVCVGDAFWKD